VTSKLLNNEEIGEVFKDEPEKLKAIIRIATKEYCYVELEVTDTLEKIKETYDKSMGMYQPATRPTNTTNAPSVKSGIMSNTEAKDELGSSQCPTCGVVYPYKKGKKPGVIWAKCAACDIITFGEDWMPQKPRS